MSRERFTKVDQISCFKVRSVYKTRVGKLSIITVEPEIISSFNVFPLAGSADGRRKNDDEDDDDNE